MIAVHVTSLHGERKSMLIAGGDVSAIKGSHLMIIIYVALVSCM